MDMKIPAADPEMARHCPNGLPFQDIAVLKATHWRQEPFLATHKTYTKPSTFVKYAIKFVSGTNPIANSKFA
jgi:hypothetical protein